MQPKALLTPAALLVGFALLAGCVAAQTKGEGRAQEDQRAVAALYRPDGRTAALPALTTNSPLHDYLLYSMLNQPTVEAAYFDWVAAVHRITVERSLPDPRLTFQADIADMVMSVMPGLMMDFPGPGKLKAAAEAATAESEMKYETFEATVLRAAFDLKKAYYGLHFLEAKLDVNRRMVGLLADLERLARAQNEVGKATLQDVLRAQIEHEQLVTETANLQDSRNPLVARFKAALGLGAGRPAPPVPAGYESTPLDLTSEGVLDSALSRNPRLKAMEADLRRADAAIRVAYKARTPDFSLGIEADAKAAPVFGRPQAGITLPLWRDKLAAQLAEARAGRRASAARLDAEQIDLAAEFAEQTFLYRESTRNLSLLRERLLPKGRESLEVARAGYASGQNTFIDVLDAQRTLLGLSLAEVEAGMQRELALTELSLLILAQPPSGAPLRPASPRRRNP